VTAGSNSNSDNCTKMSFIEMSCLFNSSSNFFKVNGVFIVHTFILSIRIYGKVELKVTYSIVCNVYRHSIPGMTSDDGKLKAVVVLYELKRSVV